MREPSICLSSSDEARAAECLARRAPCDPASYKPELLRRAIAQRMALRGLASLDDYLDFLEARPEEVDGLRGEWLGGVTWFFRDRAAFQTLARRGIDALVAGKTDGEGLRIWVVGCSTGQEAYSIAMLASEALERSSKNLGLRIVATDVRPEAIERAWHGHYDPGIEQQVGPERLHRFFERDGALYRVGGTLRRAVTFLRHDVLRDPPFQAVDLIACRNLLIYVKGAARKAVLTTFHESLRRDGLLFLGDSEPHLAPAKLFTPVGDGARLFGRKGSRHAHGSREAARTKRRTPPASPARDAENAELRRASEDLLNVLRAMQLETAVLDPKLCVRGCSAGAERFLPGIAALTGARLAQLSSVDCTWLEMDADWVLKTLAPRVRRIEARDATFWVHLHPYRSADDVPRGVLLVFTREAWLGSRWPASCERQSSADR